MNHQEKLRNLQPKHDFFIGIDSDGCVFDSMEVKQKEFFIPNALKYFDLWAVSGILRKTWEYVNLYSIYRGSNRFKSLIKVFDILSENENVIKSGVKLPDTGALREWVKTEKKLGNDTLRKFYETNRDAGLEKILRWSEAVNEDIGRWLRKLPPFPNASRAIQLAAGSADIVVVSQTPLEAIEREWKENDLEKYLRAIAGQEHGTKAEHIQMAASGKYSKNRMLMIGDAAGDLEAAYINGILFFPIIPGKENESWERFINEAFPKFISDAYLGAYQDMLTDEFRRLLPGMQV